MPAKPRASMCIETRVHGGESKAQSAMLELWREGTCSVRNTNLPTFWNVPCVKAKLVLVAAQLEMSVKRKFFSSFCKSRPMLTHAAM